MGGEEEEETDVFHSIIEEEEKKEENKSSWKTKRNLISEVVASEDDDVALENVAAENAGTEMKKKMGKYVYYKNLLVGSLLSLLDSTSTMINSSITNNMLIHVE